MKELIIGDLSKTSDKQLEFLRARTKFVGYGGARGGGKSWCVRAKSKMLAMRYPGIKILIVRRTYAELINNHINDLVSELNGFARYNKQEKVLRFFNGSTIKFGYCAADNDMLQYQGAEYDIIFLDEATQLKEDWIRRFTACLRGANDFPKRMYCTCNPGGESHGYIKRLFIDRSYEQGEVPEEYSFIRALAGDNKALLEKQPDYIKQLEALPSKLRRAWLEGDWDVYEGQFFEDFRETPDMEAAAEAGFTLSAEELREQHRFVHVIEPIDLSRGAARSWTIFRSYDFGYAKPFSVAWYAVDYDGTMYRIMEWYGCTNEPNEGIKLTPDEQFKKIREIEDTHPWLTGKFITGVADPAIWDASRGIAIAETADKYGLFFDKGDNKRIAGWMQCHYRLQFDEQGYSRFYVFANCRDFIRTIPLMVYDAHAVEDLDTQMEDHIADEWRYACMSRPISPIKPVEKQQVYFDPLDMLKGRKR